MWAQIREECLWKDRENEGEVFIRLSPGETSVNDGDYSKSWLIYSVL
jgi:hypothetical protein